MTCHKCGKKGHRVNDCPNLTYAQRKKFWADRNAVYLAKQAVPAAEKGVANDAVAKDQPPVAAPAAADMEKFENLERFLAAFKELRLDLLNVGAPVNDGLNLLSGAVSIAYENPGKQVTFAEVVKGTVNSDAKRLTLDW